MGISVINSLIIEMELKEFTCEACHKLQYMTYVLTCGHIMCRACMESCSGRLVEHNGCHVCREGDVRNPPQENFLHEDVDLLMEIKSNFHNKHPNARCHLCLMTEDYNPEVYCFDNKRYFCRAHFEIHNENNDCVFIEKREILEDNFQMLKERRTKHEPMCGIHKQNYCLAEYVCCGQLVCHRIKERDHKNHKSAIASEAIQKARKELECEWESIEKRRNECKIEAQQVEGRIGQQKAAYEREAVLFKNKFDREIEKLRRERDNKLKQMAHEQEMAIRILMEERDRKEEDLQTIYRFEKLTSLTLQILPPLQQINCSNSIKKMLRQVTGICNDEIKHEPTTADYVKLREQDKPEKLPSQPKPPLYRTKETKKATTNSPFVKKRTSYAPTGNTMTIHCPDHTKGLSDVTTDKDNNIYAADPIRNSILVYDASGKFIREIDVPISPIHNLCYFNQRLILSCDNNKVYELSLSKDTVREIAEYFLFVKGRQFIKPHGMAVSLDGKFLYVCDQADSVVYVLDEKLSKVQTVRNIPSPIGIAVAPNSKIFVLCKGNLLCEINNNVLIRSVELIGNSTGRQGYIAINKMNQIMISDSIQSSIVIYNEEGTKLRSFAGYAQTERVNYPVGITVDGDDRLIIADLGNKQIKVYSSVLAH